MWERRWSLGRRGSDCGPASVLGKGLAEASRSSLVKDLAVGLVDFLGKDLVKDRRLLVLI